MAVYTAVDDGERWMVSGCQRVSNSAGDFRALSVCCWFGICRENLIRTIMISNRQCLDLLAAKFDIISDERRSELLGKDLASSSDLTPAVLDALASICAAQKGEVFAVSAEISGDHIVLRVAGNNGVPLAVKEHLEGVWKRLQDFNPIPNKNNGHNSEHTPPMDPAEFHSEWALCQQIYQFSMNRLYRRLKKHAEKTLKVLKEWDSGDTRRWEGFDETCEVLEAIDKFFKIRSSPPEEFIIYICQLFQDIYERITPAVAAVSGLFTYQFRSAHFLLNYAILQIRYRCSCIPSLERTSKNLVTSSRYEDS